MSTMASLLGSRRARLATHWPMLCPLCWMGLRRMDDVLEIEVQAVVTVNRPEVRNALNALLIGGHEDDARCQPDVAAIVLTGATRRSVPGSTCRSRRGTLGGGGSALPIPADMGTPVIGAVNGAGTGGSNCRRKDLLIGSERAAFADTHARVGILPGWGLSVELPRAAGVRRARQMSTGNEQPTPPGAEWGCSTRSSSRRTRSSASTCHRRGGHRGGHGVGDGTVVGRPARSRLGGSRSSARSPLVDDAVASIARPRHWRPTLRLGVETRSGGAADPTCGSRTAKYAAVMSGDVAMRALGDNFPTPTFEDPAG